ncbi:MAG: hypothetical protein A2Y16_05315 [Tenericutes bacterium GWF2_57_13]|nr:MAG: hypothetical protein A2Y16_05315 [Tenericutes bacterium GWF2_57_13]
MHCGKIFRQLIAGDMLDAIFLSKLLIDNPHFFKFISYEHISSILKEIIIQELIANSIKDTSFSTEEIQTVIYNTMVSNSSNLPEELLKAEVADPHKNKLKSMLINLTTSNATNNNGLAHRNELVSEFNDAGKRVYRASDALLNFFDDSMPSMLKTLCFFSKYKYVTNYLKILKPTEPVSYNTAYCSHCTTRSARMFIFETIPTRILPALFLVTNIRYLCSDCMYMTLYKEVY